MNNASTNCVSHVRSKININSTVSLLFTLLVSAVVSSMYSRVLIFFVVVVEITGGDIFPLLILKKQILDP